MTRAVCILLLCVCVQAWGQRSAQELARKYDAFKKIHRDVTLMLLFNQEQYASGDTAWFKAHFFNSDRSPVKGRQIIDLAMVSSRGEVLQHFLFSAKDGVGYNQLVFPHDLAPGIYTIAAYNSWMKNFNPLPLYSKQIKVVGEKEVVKDEQSGAVGEHRLNIQHTSGRMVEISFSSQAGAATRFQELHLVVTSNNKIVLARTFRQALDDSVSFSVKETPGIIHVAVIDKLGRVVASENYSVQKETQAVDKLTVKIEKGQDAFLTRGKAEMTVTVLDGSGRPVQGEFAFKVLNATVNGPVLELMDPLSDAVMQQGEPWSQVINGLAKSPAEFTTRLSRKGTAYMKDGTPVPDDTKLVFYVQNNDVILQAQSWKAGRFTLGLPDISGNDVLLAFAENDGTDIPVVTITWDEISVKLPQPPMTHEGDDIDTYGAFAATAKLIDRSFGFYAASSVNAPARQASNSGLEERVEGVDATINVQDYVIFGTMAELIREIVPGLAVRTTKERSFVKVSLPEPMAVAASDPLYIIDGTVTRSTSYFLSLKPADLARIKLIATPPRLLPLGLIGKNGIVVVETLKGNARPPAAPWQIIEGINPTLTFRSKPRADRPDFRSTIYWAPSVQTDVKGKARVEFYWSDDVGPVKANVVGITKDGRVFSGEQEFEVGLEKE